MVLFERDNRRASGADIFLTGREVLGQLAVSQRLILEVLRCRQQSLRGVELRARLAANPDEDGVPSVLLALRLGIARNLVP